MTTNVGIGTDIHVSMTVVHGASSSQHASNSSSSNTTLGLNDVTTQGVDTEDRNKKRKRGGITQKMLSAVVDKGNDMTGTQIMRKGIVSRSVAFSVAKKARNYPTSDPFNKMSPISNQDTMLEMVASLRYHLVDYPYQDMVTRFCHNAECDIGESSMEDRLNAASIRRKRAHRVWAKSKDRFQGREAMNTLMCILYSPSSVNSLVNAAHEEKVERPGHIMVMRFGGAFIVLLSDSLPSSRFPLEWFLHRGDHTSAWLWMNLKDNCWLRHRDVVSSMVFTPTTTGIPLEVSTAHVQNVEVFDPWPKVSEVTQTGIHMLQFLRVKAREFAEEDVTTDTKICHIYLRPYPKTTDSKTVVSREWCTHIYNFVKQFVVSTRTINTCIHTETSDDVIAQEPSVIIEPIQVVINDTTDETVQQIQDNPALAFAVSVTDQMVVDTIPKDSTTMESVQLADVEIHHVQPQAMGIGTGLRCDGGRGGLMEVRGGILDVVSHTGPTHESTDGSKIKNPTRSTQDTKEVHAVSGVDVVPCNTEEMHSPEEVIGAEFGLGVSEEDKMNMLEQGHIDDDFVCSSPQDQNLGLVDENSQQGSYSSHSEQLWSQVDEDSRSSPSELGSVQDPWVRGVFSDTSEAF
jgi:hypothetical protein